MEIPIIPMKSVFRFGFPLIIIVSFACINIIIIVRFYFLSFTSAPQQNQPPDK